MQLTIKCECGNEEVISKFDNMGKFKLIEIIEGYNIVVLECTECGYLENY